MRSKSQGTSSTATAPQRTTESGGRCRLRGRSKRWHSRHLVGAMKPAPTSDAPTSTTPTFFLLEAATKLSGHWNILGSRPNRPDSNSQLDDKRPNGAGLTTHQEATTQMAMTASRSSLRDLRESKLGAGERPPTIWVAAKARGFQGLFKNADFRERVLPRCRGSRTSRMFDDSNDVDPSLGVGQLSDHPCLHNSRIVAEQDLRPFDRVLARRIGRLDPLDAVSRLQGRRRVLPFTHVGPRRDC